MKLFRTLVFWCHLVAAVPAALVILLMSATGVLLTYERQVIAWADARQYQVSAAGPRLSPTALLESARSSAGRGAPSSVLLRADPAAPAEVSFGRRTLFLDPYSGRVIGDGTHPVREFFHGVTDWHRWLGREGEGRDAGRALTGASNLVFLFLVVSGFYLWWPRNWSPKALRNVTLLRRGLSPKARDFNWHNAFGFWAALPLLVVVASGVVISYPWASDLVFRLSGEAPPPPRGAGGPPGQGAREGRAGGGAAAEATPLDGLDRLWARAEEQVPGWKSIGMQVPPSLEEPVRFTIDRGNGGQPQHRAQLTLDRATGEVVKWEPFSANTRGRRLRSLLRFAHTGEAGGLAGQTVAGLASAAGVVLVWTGLALSWRRLGAWVRRRSQRGGAVDSRETGGGGE